MQFTFAQYEVLYGTDVSWQDVSEKTAMDRIADYYDQVSPVLFDLFQGKIIVTPDAVFRIKKIAGAGIKAPAM